MRETTPQSSSARSTETDTTSADAESPAASAAATDEATPDEATPDAATPDEAMDETPASEPREVTRLLQEMQQGNDGAADALVPLVYDELHRLAVHFMRRERDDHTLQPTALVHDAYLRLVDQRHASWQNRAHFYGIAARAMRRILVDHARRRSAGKRDGGQRITLDESVVADSNRSLELLALDDALTRLGELDPRQARVVELRYFSGLSVEQTAEALGISRATANRDWTFARAFLQRELDAT